MRNDEIGYPLLPDVVQEMAGKTISKIEGAYKGSEEIKILMEDGTHLFMFHRQCCCETVEVEELLRTIENDIIIFVCFSRSGVLAIARDSRDVSDGLTVSSHSLPRSTTAGLPLLH